MSSSATPRLAPREHCTGCSACASGCPRAAIRMVPDREGFLYPEMTDACVFCGHCTYILPGAEKNRELRPDPTAFAVWNEDDALREQSTCGGALRPSPPLCWSPAAWFSAQPWMGICAWYTHPSRVK